MKNKRHSSENSTWNNSLKLFIGLFVFCSTLTYAQPAQLWMQAYHNPNGSGTDYSEKTIMDAAGNSFVAGRTRTASTGDDIMLLKYSPGGTLLWSKAYNHVYNGTEQPNDICLDNSGNIYITGTSTRAMDSHDGIIIKYDPSGNILWVRRIGKSNFANRKAAGESLVVNSSLYVGADFTYDGKTECGILKYNLNGDSVSYHSLGIANNFSYRLVKIISDNSTNIYTLTSGDLLPNEGEDFIVKKHDFNGNYSQVWTKTYTGTGHLDDRANDIAIGPDGNVFLTGFTEVNNQSYNVLMLKLGRDDGAIILQKTYNDAITNYMDYGMHIRFDANSNIIVTGVTSALNAESEILLLKYSPAGALLWTKKYEHPGDRSENPIAMVMDSYGNLYITGYTVSYTLQISKILTLKFSSAGDIEWYVEVDATGTGNQANSINLDPDGNVVIAGSTQTQNIYYASIIKYGSTIGIQQISNELPSDFELKQNYPNPFNPVTNINFSIPAAGNVKLVVFDISGKEAAELVNENLSAGTYNFDFNASHLSSGVYFYRIDFSQTGSSTGGFSDVKKMMLIK